MKKIFTANQFDTNERGEYDLSGITPAEYLEKLYSNIEEGELYIAKSADEEGYYFITATDLSDATEIDRYTVDASKSDAAAIAAQEHKLYEVCKKAVARREKEETAMTFVKAATESVTDQSGLRIDNVVLRARRLTKLLQLGAPDLIIAGERRDLAEELALNAIASSCEVIAKEDFSKAFGI